MIKNIFNPGVYSTTISGVLLFLRVSFSLLMLTHGSGKFLMLMGDEAITFADPIGIGQSTSLALTVFAEVFCSVLLIFGVASRLAAFALFFTMLVAAFVVHLDHGLAKQEMSMLYGSVYLALTVAGAGKFSLDHVIYSRIAVAEARTSTEI